MPPGAREDPVGQVDHLRGGAVVPDEPDHLRAVVAAREVGEEGGGGAGEGVDGLGDVADDAELAPVAQPQVEQALLERGDVLVLVDDEVAVLAADLRRDVLPLEQDADQQEQHVLEVDDAALVLDVLVDRQQPGDGGVVVPGGALAPVAGPPSRRSPRR